jgi:DNA-binding transcriptional regulator WhiA
MYKVLNQDKILQAYVIGLALGDGNLSNPNGRAVRLRISCDKKYPFLNQKIYNSLKILLPNNKVGIVNRDSNCIDISVYSNHLENLLGWKARLGPKFLQKASVPEWIKSDEEYIINCLRGLIETDGSIYSDRKYKMVIFKNIVLELAQDFYEMISTLGFEPNFYQLDKDKVTTQFNQQTAYQVRLSKNVAEFLELVKPEKI